MTDYDIENLADVLIDRIENLAAAARDTSAAIQHEQALEREGSVPIDDLIVDAVVQRVDSIAAGCDELNRILAGYDSLVGENRHNHHPNVAPAAPGDAVDATGSEQGPKAPEISEGVRLLATQMSIAGSGPTEIAQRLRDEFGVENSAALVRELFERN